MRRLRAVIAIFLGLTFTHAELEAADPSCMLQQHVVVNDEKGLPDMSAAALSRDAELLVIGDAPIAMSLSDSARQQSTPTAINKCPEVHATLPCSILLAILLFSVGYLVWWNTDSSPQETARSTGLFIQFAGMANYSMVILEAYQLAHALHFDAAFSGQLIGIYMGATAVGGLAMALKLWYQPGIWKNNPRTTLITAQIFNITGFCIYAYVTEYVASFTIDTFWESRNLAAALLAARICSGVGHGVTATLLQVSFAHLTPTAERPAQMTRFMFVNTLGIGMGPMIAAGLRVLHFCPPGQPGRFELVGQAQLILATVALLSLYFYPNLSGVEDYVDLDHKGTARGPMTNLLKQPDTPESQKRDFAQKVIVCGCMLATLVRAMVTSGVEGATSLLLETEYMFAPSMIGLIIGATFLCCVPAKFMIDAGKSRLTVTEWIRLLCGVSLIGCILLFRQNWRFLIAADVLLFPSLYLSDGMVRGLMQQYALPAGSILDQTGTTLIAMLLNSTGRFLGPWMARLLLETVNQRGYALLQVVLALIFLVVFELTIVRPQEIVNQDVVFDAKECS